MAQKKKIKKPIRKTKTKRPIVSIANPQRRRRRVRIPGDPPNPVGRPSIYSQELAERICMEISTTRDALVTICERNDDFPNHVTIYRWLAKNEQFRNLYARAKEDQLQVLADEIIPIADICQTGEIVTTKGKGKRRRVERRVADMIERARLRIDARKWLLSKLNPKKYGDRIEVSDGRDPLNDLIKELNSQHNNPLNPEIPEASKETPQELPEMP